MKLKKRWIAESQFSPKRCVSNFLLLCSYDSLFFVNKNQFSECEAAKLALRDLEDRHQELLILEKNIQEVRDLFVELNHLVECQVKMFFFFLLCGSFRTHYDQVLYVYIGWNDRQDRIRCNWNHCESGGRKRMFGHCGVEKKIL